MVSGVDAVSWSKRVKGQGQEVIGRKYIDTKFIIALSNIFKAQILVFGFSRASSITLSLGATFYLICPLLRITNTVGPAIHFEVNT
jgi:hypothetical protein